MSALEKRVAELEEEVFGVATPEVTEEEIAEAASGTQPALGGTAHNLLPPGEDGAVAVVASGPRDGSQIPLVVRNNTTESAVNVNVKVEAYNSSGSLLAVGEMLFNHPLKPYLLQPGDYAIGFARLAGELSQDVEYMFAVTSTQASEAQSDIVDVVIEQATWQTDRVVEIFRNPSDEQLEATYMGLVCFFNRGTPVLADYATISDRSAPGGTTSFQITEFAEDFSVCEKFFGCRHRLEPTNRFHQ